MRKETWTIKAPGSGEVLGTFVVEAESVREDERPAKPAALGGGSNGPTGPESADRMTEPQKRYLFRLLGAQNIEGKKAEEHLKTYFKVSRLGDITRAAASSYIDQLVKDKKDAAS